MTTASILAFTETWLTRKVKDLPIPGYKDFRNDRRDGKGGVCLLVSQDLHASALEIDTDLEVCGVTVASDTVGPVIIIAMYRSPKLSLAHFIPRLQDVLHLVEQQYRQDVFFVGDFNEDQLKLGHHAIKDTFASYGFRQSVSKSTTVHGSLLDYAYIKTRNYHETTSVISTYYSDHDAIHISLSDVFP